MKESENFIDIQGARVHNLKNVSLKIPREKLVVITGLSGSGKSSLAFDTIYAEGQRRYMETFSAYTSTKPDPTARYSILPSFWILMSEGSSLSIKGAWC